MTLCKVILCGLKPSDVNYSTNDRAVELPLQRQRQHSFNTTTSINRVEGKVSSENDYLNVHIKPMPTQTNSVRVKYH